MVEAPSMTQVRPLVASFFFRKKRRRFFLCLGSIFDFRLSSRIWQTSGSLAVLVSCFCRRDARRQANQPTTCSLILLKNTDRTIISLPSVLTQVSPVAQQTIEKCPRHQKTRPRRLTSVPASRAESRSPSEGLRLSHS